MPIKRIIITLVILVPLFGIAQMDSSRVKNKLIISASPIHLLEFYHGASANLGFEIRSNDRYSFYGEFGKYLPNSAVANNYYQSGYTLSGELKRYFNNGKTYLSFQYIYGEQSYTRSDVIGYTYEYDCDCEYEEFMVYQVQKKFQDFSFRYGGLYVIKKRLTFNPYVGFGLRFQEADIDINDQLAAQRYLGSWSVPHNWIHEKGQKIYPKVHLGLRIGFKIF
mgnify:CR=1 FL=1